jgi:hypothetical protein
MLEFDFAFPHSYEVHELREWPGTGSLTVPVIYFPPPKNRVEHDGLWLRVQAKSGKAWDRRFCIRLQLASGFFSHPQFTRPRECVRRVLRKCLHRGC